MDEKLTGAFEFESREGFEQAKKEAEIIQNLLEKADISDSKTALKIYNKAVSDKLFSTITGYEFLLQLRKTILKSGLASERTLASIPVKASAQKRKDIMSERPSKEGRFRKLYEGQKLINKKLKIAVIALVILLAGFVAVNFRFEYTIFTYFTNYKAKMEEELIDKYEKWDAELKAREDRLDQSQGQSEE